MGFEAEEFSSDLIDVSGLSLADLEALPDSSLAVALREVLAGDDVGTSAGFSSRLRRAG
jgi:FXSXX-COOH protein